MNFTTNLKNLTGIALIAIASFNLSSCKKDDKVDPIPTLEDSKAIVNTSTIYVPSKSTTYYDLVNDKVSEEKATSTINLSGMYGSTLKPSTTDYKFGYFDLEGKTIEDIKVADLKNLDFKETDMLGIDASSATGEAPEGPTWIIYDSPNNHAVYPTANRFVVLYKGGDTLSENNDEVVIFVADDITALNGNATYTLKIKRFVK